MCLIIFKIISLLFNHKNIQKTTEKKMKVFLQFVIKTTDGEIVACMFIFNL